MKFRWSYIIALITAGIFLVLASPAGAQDIHFSQFNQAPLRQNPALTGQFNGGYRISGIYRNQWASVTVPYTTFSLSGDAQSFAKVNNLGMGLDFFTDQAGDGKMGTFNINLSGSYPVYISKNRKHKVTIGTQFGWVKQQIDPSKLTFDNHYFSGSSIEDFSQNRSYLNLNLGGLWHVKFKLRQWVNIGYAMHHINTPKPNFYASENNQLAIRNVIHAQYSHPVTANLDVLPSLQFMQQGPHKELTIGANAKYILDQRSTNYRAIYAGIWTRTGDAAFVILGLDYNATNVGISYDFNYSSLRTSSGYRGGFEISIIHIFSQPLPERKRFKTCPTYI